MSSTVYIVLIITAIVIEAVTTPFFLHYQRPGANPKSLALKMICATMFMAVGILVYFYSGNTSEFAKFMLIGLASSWMGDLFLHLKKDCKVTFGIGFIFFAAAHVLYLIAYSKATKQYFPDKAFLTLPELAAVIFMIVVLFILFKGKGQINFMSSFMPVFAVYGFILISMFIKAVSFSIQFIMADGNVWGGVCLALGGALFCSSDLTLVLLMFNEKWKKSYRLKDYNIGSYFLGQTLLALSVLFIGLT